jgi:hypothetical protein
MEIPIIGNSPESTRHAGVNGKNCDREWLPVLASQTLPGAPLRLQWSLAPEEESEFPTCNQTGMIREL